VAASNEMQNALVRKMGLYAHRQEGSPDKGEMPILVISGSDSISEKVKDCIEPRLKNRLVQIADYSKASDFIKIQEINKIILDASGEINEALEFLKTIYDESKDIAAAPVVVVVNSTDQKQILEILNNGAQDYIFGDGITPASLGIALGRAKDLYNLKKARYETEQRLNHAMRLETVGQLTSGVAHDFSNLLTVMMGNTRLLRRKIENKPDEITLEEIDKKVEAIENAATKGKDLIGRMLRFSRQGDLTEDIANINDCIGETMELIRRTIGENIEIIIKTTTGIWPVSIDRREFENALINLSVNARDAMPQGGKLSIETSNVILDQAYLASHPEVSPGPYVMIAVSDTGAGIPAEVVQKIFEPFFTTKEPGHGTGLGLAMVYGFIKQSRGHINVYSEPGFGTVFRMYLPRVREKEVHDELAERVETGGTETILVVEDDEDLRFMASNMLSKLGYTTMEAPDGVSALEIIKKNYKKIDLVFTDIVMPGGVSGIDLVQKMREYYPDLKVLYTSGYSPHAIPDYQLSLGDEMISKPYRRGALAKKLRKVLDEI
jgi:signal transduction histidine kinase